MAFIEKADLYTKILQDELEEITRGDDTLITNAISAAEGQIKVYLNDSYDIDSLLTATGDDRHQFLLQICADLAVYYLVARVQAGQDVQDRKDRHDRGIKFLKMAKDTGTYPDFPRRENTQQTHISYGGNTKRGNYY